MRYRIDSLAVLILAVVFGAGCSGPSLLNTVDFEARTLAVVADVPGAPYFADEGYDYALWGQFTPETRAAIDPSLLLKDHRKPARARYDSAMAYVDFTERIVSRVLIQTATHLGCRPLDDDAAADYVFYIDLHDYGFQANVFTLTSFYLEAELHLIDNRTGERIWKKKLREHERAAEVLAELIPQHGKVFMVKDLARLDVEAMILVIETATDFTAERLATALRRDYYANRYVDG